MPQPSRDEIGEKIRSSFENLVEGLRDAVEDVSTLEVNTMVVSNITGLKFNPRLAYRLLYDIPHYDPPKQENVIKDDDYYRPLLDQYCTNPLYPSLNDCVADNNEKISRHNLDVARKSHLKLRERLEEEAKMLKQNNDYHLAKLMVPESDDLKSLLSDKSFISSLRKLHELRALVEKGQAADPNNVYDNIYAQTTIQIDGDVINSFNQRLFEENKETREFLIDVHRDAVVTGQQNWQSLLHLMVDMLAQIMNIKMK